MLYTIIDEGYHVTICRSFKSLMRRAHITGYVFKDGTPATEQGVRARLKHCDCARLFNECDMTDWNIKIERHEKAY
jgi:hypothetical protein